MVAWLAVPGSPFCGPLFDWIDGTLARVMDQALAVEISGMVERLHSDAELATRLPGPVGSCAQAYLSTYHSRFTEDLAFVAADPPPFVDGDLIAWMGRQVAMLESQALTLAAFLEPADRPVHRDLWLNNIMLDPRGDWHLLDWDGLVLSDPVIDWAMLFGPTRGRPQAAREEDVLEHALLSAEQRQRLAVYAQASQLDWILDPLADWVQGGHEPEHGDQVRAGNERIHRQALEVYEARYGP